jgi:hypothetical protein
MNIVGIKQEDFRRTKQFCYNMQYFLLWQLGCYSKKNRNTGKPGKYGNHGNTGSQRNIDNLDNQKINGKNVTISNLMYT